MPRRIQMSRQHPWRADNTDAVIVSRPTKWGNPWRVQRVHCHDGGRCWGTTVPNVLGDRVTYHDHRDSRLDAAQAAVTAFRHAILWPVSPQPAVPDLDDIRRELAGRDLVCWCVLDQPCHADVLLELANPKPEPIGDAVRQMAFRTYTCAWCGERPMIGTAPDVDGTMLPTCGQEGHGNV